MIRHYLFVSALIFTTTIVPAQAKDRLKLETTIIKSNKEMPQIVYIVPWKDLKGREQKEQTLVLHSLFGDLFDPMKFSAQSANRNQTSQAR